MRGTTHLVVGMNAAWVGLLFAPVSASWGAVFAVVGAVAGLLPDIDARGAKIHFVGGGALGMFRGAFTHRGFFHSIFALAVLTFGVWMGARAIAPVLAMVAGLGYASHLLIDGFNFAGARYLFPSRRKCFLVPKWLASPNGGAADQLFFVLGGAGALAYLLLLASVTNIGAMTGGI